MPAEDDRTKLDDPCPVCQQSRTDEQFRNGWGAFQALPRNLLTCVLAMKVRGTAVGKLTWREERINWWKSRRTYLGMCSDCKSMLLHELALLIRGNGSMVDDVHVRLEDYPERYEVYEDRAADGASRWSGAAAPLMRPGDDSLNYAARLFEVARALREGRAASFRNI